MIYFHVYLYYNIGLTKRQQNKEHLQMLYIYDDGGWIFRDGSDRSADLPPSITTPSVIIYILIDSKKVGADTIAIQKKLAQLRHQQ